MIQNALGSIGLIEIYISTHKIGVRSMAGTATHYPRRMAKVTNSLNDWIFRNYVKLTVRIDMSE